MIQLMTQLSKTNIDEILDTVYKDIGIEGLSDRNTMIQYLVNVYGDQWSYKKRIPVLYYVLLLLYFLWLWFLIFVGINGWLAWSDELRIGFHRFWVFIANAMYFFSFFLISITVFKFLLSRGEFRIPYKFILGLTLFVPFTWWIGSLISKIFQ